MDKRQCVICGDMVDYIKVLGPMRQTVNGNYYRPRPTFVNLKNERWWGKKCPECRDETTPLFVTKIKFNRKCRRCAKVIDGPNRFYHPSCLELATAKYDASDYGYSYGG